MDYLSLTFLVFLLAFLAVYYMLKPVYRYIAVFVGSYIFYGFANPKMLLVLAGITIVSYVGGLVIHKTASHKAFTGFFFAEILVLLVFKYTNFTIENINLLSEKTGLGRVLNINWDIALPIGLSFMVFQACTYLSDVYRKNLKPERNLIRYGAFVAFFPTVLSGPIQKARNLLPQIKKPKPFNFTKAREGTILFIWGAFEKIMVANKLSLISNTVLGDHANRSSAEILVGAVCFSLYIYADFSSYSDMARGVSRILGIDVGKNFNNPYLSQSTAEFWNRWHISLNEWFVENVYIPLGGNRKGTIRKYLNMMVVFFISGLWHGAYWHFVAWGVLNGIFAVIGQIIKPFKQKAYKLAGLSEKAESIVLIRRLIVFYLITLTWVFFTANIPDACSICRKLIFFDYLSVFNPDLLTIAGSAVSTFMTAVATLVFCKVQIGRQDEEKISRVYCSQPFLLQCLPAAIMICICIFGACATDASVDTQFLYFQF